MTTDWPLVVAAPLAQRGVVEAACRDDNVVWVAECEGTVAGFVAYTINTMDKLGSYEKAGFTRMAAVNYFKQLG